jgi:hypothetical protein
MELEDARRREEMSEAERAAEESNGRVNLARLNAERADRLVGRALAELDDDAYMRPLVIDGIVEAFDPDARRRVYDRLVSHARRRQIVLITGSDEVARWAAHGPENDASVGLYAAQASRLAHSD